MIGTMTKWRNRSCRDWRISVLEFFGLSDELLALFGRREVFHSENSINIVDMLSHDASLPKEQLDLRRRTCGESNSVTVCAGASASPLTGPL